MTSQLIAVRAAVVTVCTTLFGEGSGGYDANDPILICNGMPGAYQPPRIVAILTGARGDIERPVMSPARPREEVVTVELTFSVLRNGDVTSAQPKALADAFGMYDKFSDYYKTKPNETLGGACREALVTSWELAESQALDPLSQAPTGRIAEIHATLTARGRI